jgi:hypothetical protein
MKLKIPEASQVFNKKPSKKNPSVEQIVMYWLNTDVFRNIMEAEPELTGLKVTGRVTVEVPYEGYHDSIDNKKEFIKIVKELLKPLGYKVEFTYDGNGVSLDICIIKWEHKV